MRWCLPLLVPLLAACPIPVAPPDWCDGTARFDYAPDREAGPTAYPDDFWTLPGDTPTGLQIHLQPDQIPGIEETFGNVGSYLSVFDHLSELDGWGLTAGIVMPFTRPLNPLTPDDVAIVAFPEAGGPIVIAADPQMTDFDRTVVLLPRQPLPPGTLAAAAIFTSATGTDGTCAGPSRDLRELLSPETELDDGIPADVRSPDYAAAAAALGRPVEDIAAMLTFTTQSATRLSYLVRDDILSRPAPTPTAPFACAYEAANDWTVCDGTIDVLDYRREDHTMDPLGDGAPLGEHALPTRAWLPGNGTGGPFPTILYGHGLSHDRSQGTKIAREVVAGGVAVLAVDAVEHGDHPSRTEAPLELLEALTFFGIQFSPSSVDGRLIRDNWRQSTFDKLQVVELVADGFDVDGDGTDDFDLQQLQYVGISLGAIMGPELLTLSDAFTAGVLNVPGGRTTGIIQDSDLFSPLLDVMAPEGTTQGDIARFFPLLQTIVDPGDSMVWAPRVRDVTPQILVQIAYQDGTIPNSTNEAVSRAFGIDGVGREVWPIADVDFVPGPVPDAGITQFDEVTRNGEVETAGHDNIFSSDEPWAAIEHFLATGEVVDPYSPD